MYPDEWKPKYDYDDEQDAFAAPQPTKSSYACVLSSYLLIFVFLCVHFAATA